MDVKLLAGAGILVLLAMAMAGVFTTHNALNNPAAPIDPPQISFSDPYVASQYEVLENNIQAMTAQQGIYMIKVADGETQGTKTDEATKSSIAWTITVKNGMCNGSIASTHTKEDGTIVNLNEEMNDGLSSNCDEWDILMLFIRWIQKAIEKKIGVPAITFVVREVFELIIEKMNFQSINSGDFWIIISNNLNR